MDYNINIVNGKLYKQELTSHQGDQFCRLLKWCSLQNTDQIFW